MEVTVEDNGIKNIQVLPPYQGRQHFKIMIPPYESAAILGIRLSYSLGSCHFKYSPKIVPGGPGGQFPRGSFGANDPPHSSQNQPRNMGNIFANYLKFNISSNSTSNNNLRTEEYNFIRRDLAKKMPIFNSTLFTGEDSLKQSMMIQDELTPQKLMKKYPNEFNYLFKKFPIDTNPFKQNKWTIIKKSDGSYIGQINKKTGELEGLGVYYWKIGVRYIGYFRKNKLHGNGIVIDKENHKVYEGHFVDNKKNGFGKLYYVNGEFYEGEFNDDKMDGEGIYHFKNGDVWEGVFENKKKNGVGIMKRKNGEIFLTEYEEDNFIGEVPLNNEEKNYIENLRQNERKDFLEQKKMTGKEQQKEIHNKKNESVALFNLYKKKRDLTTSIIVYN